MNTCVMVSINLLLTLGRSHCTRSLSCFIDIELIRIFKKNSEKKISKNSRWIKLLRTSSSCTSRQY